MVHGDAATKVQRLLDDFDNYDTYVDIVSAFEWLFLHSDLFAGRVRHFERFPKVVMPDGTECTPDFTVIFNDDTGIVAEIAKLALHEKSVDSLVQQIGKYAQLDRLPIDAEGTCIPVAKIDVMHLVPFHQGLDAVRRIINERMLNPEHPYDPPEAPVIVQYSRDDVRYTFQRLQNPENGRAAAEDDPPTTGYLIDRGLDIRIERFVGIKASSKFMNDPIDPLYFATHLWTQHWPTEHPNVADDITVTPAGIAQTLRERFGKCRADDVRRALGLLHEAGVAADNKDGTWEVSRKKLRLIGETDVHRIIAGRAAKASRPIVTAKATKREEPLYQQGQLF
jgi:hypothetical protein